MGLISLDFKVASHTKSSEDSRQQDRETQSIGWSPNRIKWYMMIVGKSCKNMAKQGKISKEKQGDLTFVVEVCWFRTQNYSTMIID